MKFSLLSLIGLMSLSLNAFATDDVKVGACHIEKSAISNYLDESQPEFQSAVLVNVIESSGNLKVHVVEDVFTFNEDSAESLNLALHRARLSAQELFKTGQCHSIVEDVDAGTVVQKGNWIDKIRYWVR